MEADRCYPVARVRESGATPSADVDAVFDLLSAAPRRHALYHLRCRSGPVDVTELAGVVAAWGSDATLDSVAPERKREAHLSLLHTHLPRLAEAGAVEYDSDAGRVALAETDGFLLAAVDAAWIREHSAES